MSIMSSERALHWQWGEALLRDATERDDDIDDLFHRMEHLGSAPGLALVAPEGAGKTMLLALTAQKLARLPGITILRFVGATPRSTFTNLLVRDIVNELASALGEADPVPFEADALRDRFQRCLLQSTQERPIVVIIDAVERLDRPDLLERWLPHMLIGDAAAIASGPPSITRLLPRYQKFRLSPLPPRHVDDVLDRWLGDARASQSAEHRITLRRAYSDSGSLLNLRLAAELTRVASLPEFDSNRPADIDAHIDAYFDHIVGTTASSSTSGTASLASMALSLLAASRFGLPDEEWRAALNDLTQAGYQGSALDDAQWAQVLDLLAPLVVSRLRQGQGNTDFRHERLRFAAQRWTAKRSTLSRWHGVLARHFATAPLYRDVDRAVPNQAKVAELLYQLRASQQLEAWCETLCDLPFLMASAQAGLINVLIADLEAEAPSLPRPLLQRTAPWIDFLRSYAELFLRATPNWPADRVLQQLAAEQAAFSPVSVALREWEQRHSAPPTRLASTVTRSARTMSSVRIFEGHTNAIQETRLLQDGRLLSWCAQQHDGSSRVPDTSVRIWNLETGKCDVVFSGDGSPINGLLETGTGSIVSWTAGGHVHVWNPIDGSIVYRYQEHAGEEVRGVLQLPDRRFLSWAADGTVRRWSPEIGGDGEIVATLANPVRAIVPLSDERVLVVSNGEQTIWSLREHVCVDWRHDYGSVVHHSPHHIISRLVDPAGNDRLLVETYDQEIIGLIDEQSTWDRWHDELFARYHDLGFGFVLPELIEERNPLSVLVLDDGRMVTWRSGRTWNPRAWLLPSGECAAVLPGAGVNISGMAPLRDGRVVYWGRNGLLRLWDVAASGKVVELDADSTDISFATQLRDGTLITGDVTGMLRAWDLLTATCTAVFEGHTDAVTGVLEFDDHRMASWSGDRTIRVWRRDDHRLNVKPRKAGRGAQRPDVDEPDIRSTAALADGVFATWSGYSQVQLWNGRTGDQLAKLEHPRGRIGFMKAVAGNLVTEVYGNEWTLSVWDSTASLRARRTRIAIGDEYPWSSLSDGVLRVMEWGRRYAVWDWTADSLTPFEEFADQRATLSIDGKPAVLTPPPQGRTHASQRIVLNDGSLGPLVRMLAAGGLIGWEGATLTCWELSGRTRWAQRRTGSVGGATVLRDGRILTWPKEAGPRSRPTEILDPNSGRTEVVLSNLLGRPYDVRELEDTTLLATYVRRREDTTYDLPLHDRIVHLSAGGEVLGIFTPAGLFEHSAVLWHAWASLREVGQGTLSAAASGNSVLVAYDGHRLYWHDEREWVVDEVDEHLGIVMTHRGARPAFLQIVPHR